MTLNITSSFPDLEKELRAIDADGSANAAEFQHIRDGADNVLSTLGHVETASFQALADQLVESMQRLALDARKQKLNDADRDSLKKAAEFQLSYVIVGYQSSLQRL